MKLKQFIQQETVLTAAAVLAVVSAFFVLPDAQYLGYIDLRTLAILFSLMTVMAGLRRQGFFDGLGRALLSRTHSTFQLTLVLVGLCFFGSMGHHQRCFLADLCAFYICGTERPCAGHPPGADHPSGVHADHRGQPWQYAHAHRQPTEPLPLRQKRNEHGGVPPASCFPIHGRFAACFWWAGRSRSAANRNPPASVRSRSSRTSPQTENHPAGCGAVCGLSAGGRPGIAYGVAFAAVLVCTLCADRSTLRNVDYSLLLTFVAFFRFIGNLGRIPAFSGWLQAILAGREVLVAVLASQVTSNVPAALLLSGFTDKTAALIIGTNLGGLGTLIASMASLISYRQIARELPEEKGRYFKLFTLSNLIFLVILLAEWRIIGR